MIVRYSFLLGFVLTGAALSTVAAGELSREEVLAESGFRGGLVVEVGCRDASLAVSMAEAPNVLWHALADADRLVERDINFAAEDLYYGLSH